MLFYVPEWDDSVDANYDFTNDEQSHINKSDREHAFIWDLFPPKNIPIDGVLLSREHVESTQKTANRLLNNGVYDDPHLDLPDWLPTISDCGAFGYRNLPFPPYATTDMLEFYETLDVTTGVTIDHMVMGDEPDTTRLYLDETAFSDSFTPTDLPDTLHQHVDVMIDDWPDTWPDTVATHEPSICNTDTADAFTTADFTGTPEEICTRLADDPRAVYRENDTEFRYELSIENALEMRRLHNNGDWSFRLMAAVQGWNTGTYQSATKRLLEAGYDYIGIGGVAAKGSNTVSQLTTSINTIISRFQNTHSRRIDLHIFGFAKSDLFSTIATEGTSSFDSASMLRSAWTGGNNYHLPNEQYDALRVRYPSPTDTLNSAIETSLASQTLLYALTAFDTQQQTSELLQYWFANAHTALHTLESYLATHRHDAKFDSTRLRDIEHAFRDDFSDGKELQASFSSKFRRRLVKLLRKDSPADPIDFSEYTNLIDNAKRVFASFSPPLQTIRDREQTHSTGSLETVWPIVDWYTSLLNDTELQSNYRALLEEQPWELCDCPMCDELGIDITIFRGNDRNCRRGFHNTYQFYQDFSDSIPKIAAGAITPTTTDTDSTESVLATETPAFWEQVIDLPVAEVGLFTADGLYEHWDDTPEETSPTRTYTSLSQRYSHIFVYAPESIPDTISTALTDTNCIIWTYTDPEQLHNDVQKHLSSILNTDTNTMLHSPTPN